MAQAATDAMFVTQTAALKFLEAEMHALMQMMPGADAATFRNLPSDEGIEQNFENVPI